MKKVIAAVVTGACVLMAGVAQADDAGKNIYDTKCFLCHAAGVAGAPKFGDKEAWAPRIAKGTDALMHTVMNGLNAMPPKGTCMDCSEADLKAAMEYMVSNAK